MGGGGPDVWEKFPNNVVFFLKAYLENANFSQMRLIKIKIAKSTENQGNWKLTRVNSVTGHPSQELQVSSTSFFSPSYFLCNPVFVGFDEILFWQNAIFTLNVYNGQSQSVPGAFTLFFLRMLK